MQHEVNIEKTWEGSAQRAKVVSGGEWRICDGTVVKQQPYLYP